MAADYAGAIAAIKQKFIDGWGTTTPYGFVNEIDPTMDDGDGNPTIWVLFEVVSLGSRINGSGKAGSQVIVYSGLIKAHVFAPTGSGTGEASGAMSKALAIGELFRNQLFYNGVTDGCYVRSGYDRNDPPRIEEGDVNSVDGEWFSISAVIPFEYWHRG